ncbi:MAG: hypothetical protein ACM3X6_04620 [Patescibacteria group bacterium]
MSKVSRCARQALRLALILALIPAFGWHSGRAADGSCFSVPRAPAGQVLDRLAAAYGPLSPIEGEVAAVGETACRLERGGVELVFAWAPGSVVFANGLPACPQAIRPVTAGARFWARIWLDAGGAAHLAEAVYCGGELLLTGVEGAELSGIAPETGGLIRLTLSDGCLVPPLHPGQSVYVLLDLENRVRWLRVFS